jgi:predicted RNase H-like HicB family nuclease
MKTAYNISFQLVATVIEDEDTGFFSASCSEFPEAFAQGKTHDEAVKNLIDLIPFVLKDREENNKHKSIAPKHAHVFSQQLNVSVFA